MARKALLLAGYMLGLLFTTLKMETLCSSKTSVKFYHTTSQNMFLQSIKETIM
jgi:hypothetical protein